VLGVGSFLPDVDGLGAACFFGSAFFSCGGGGGGLDSSFGFDSSVFAGSGSEGADSLLGAASFEPESAFGAPSPPSSRRTRSCPTTTVSSSFAKYSLMVPAAGALTATSIWRARYELAQSFAAVE
jgi:hypothetical protein